MFPYAVVRQRTAQSSIIAVKTKGNRFTSATSISRRWKSQHAVVSSSLSEEENAELPSSSPLSTASWVQSTMSCTRITDPRNYSSENSRGAPIQFTAPSPTIDELPINTSSSSSAPSPPMTGMFVKLQAIFSRQKQQKEKKQNKNQSQQQKKNASHKGIEQVSGLDDMAPRISKQFTSFAGNINDNKPSSLCISSSQQMERVDNVIRKYFQHQQEQRQQLQEPTKDDNNYQLLFLQSNEVSNSTRNNNSGNNAFSWRNVGQQNHRKKKKDISGSQQHPLRNNRKNNEQEQLRNVELPKYATSISLGNLSKLSRISMPQILQYLQKFGLASSSTATGATLIPMEEAELLLLEIGGYHIVRKDEETEPINTPEISLQQQPRPPVVCMMGHVDHGKTT